MTSGKDQTTTPKIEMILHRDQVGEFQLWACRGAGKCCNRNRSRKSVPCDDCMGPLAKDMTLGEVHERITRGEA